MCKCRKNHTKLTEAYEIAPAMGYNHAAVRADRSGVANMILKQVNMPHTLRPGDSIARFWCNGIPRCAGTRPKFEEVVPAAKWLQAYQRLETRVPSAEQLRDHPEDAHFMTSGGLVFVDASTDESFLRVLQFLVGKRFTVTGGGAVWLCPRGGTNPILRLTAVRTGVGRKLYNGNDGPNVLPGYTPRTFCQFTGTGVMACG